MIEVKLWNKDNDRTLVSSYLKNRKESYNHESEKSEEWFKWKFTKSPYGEAIMPVAVDGGKVVGSNSYGIYPLLRDNTLIDAVMPYDAFVHADHQGKGIFKKLINLAENEANKRGVKILIAFPNKNSLRGFISMNWNYIPDLVRYWVNPIISPKMFFRFLDFKKPFVPNKPVGINNFDFRPTSCTLYKMEIHGKWTADYLKWRFCDLPQAEYHYLNSDDLDCLVRVGYRGHLKEAQILFLNTEMFTVSNSDFKKLKKLIINKVQPDLISFPMSKYYPLYKRMKSFGFFRLRSGTNFVYKTMDSSLGDAPLHFSLCGLDFHTY